MRVKSEMLRDGKWVEVDTWDGETGFSSGVVKAFVDSNRPVGDSMTLEFAGGWESQRYTLLPDPVKHKVVRATFATGYTEDRPVPFIGSYTWNGLDIKPFFNSVLLQIGDSITVQWMGNTTRFELVEVEDE